jgi:hypothetical protein
MDAVRLGTPFGLAFASGLNAYLPMLAFSLSVRWLHLYTVNPNFTFITSDWFIAILVIFTILDFVADKIPVIDHTWDAVHTIIRPILGAIVATAAGSQSLTGAHQAAFTTHAGSTRTVAELSVFPLANLALLVFFLIGGGLAALSHTAKATTRLASTFTTAGMLNIILSVLEDVLVIIIVLLSLFASAIMLILLVFLLIVLVPQVIRIWRARIRRKRGTF